MSMSFLLRRGDKNVLKLNRVMVAQSCEHTFKKPTSIELYTLNGRIV